MTFRFDHETARGLVIRCRGDWDITWAEGPLARARHPLGWDDRKIARVLLQVMQDDDATPADLARAIDHDRPVAARTGGSAPPVDDPEYAEYRAAMTAAAALASARLAESARAGDDE